MYREPDSSVKCSLVKPGWNTSLFFIVYENMELYKYNNTKVQFMSSLKLKKDNSKTSLSCADIPGGNT